MDYSPFNPLIWLIFAGCIVATYLTVKVFHSKYPDYPYKGTEEEK
jgi:hypothetical protein